MKNIERPEVIRAFAKLFRDNDICSYDFSNENDCDKCALLPICDEEITYEKLFQWLNSEYIEPHHWEPWELEAMKHLNDKSIIRLRGEKGSSLGQFIDDDGLWFTLKIDFPTLKDGEVIEIDSELERNGMKR